MELLFFAGIILLMVATVYCAPKIVRGKFSFTTFALLLLFFYALLFFYKQNVFYAVLTALCVCSVGYALLLYKKKQHDPNLLTLENCRTTSDLQLRYMKEKRAAKYDFYKHWYVKLILLNIALVILFALAKFIH